MKKFLIFSIFFIFSAVITAGCMTGSPGGQNMTVTPAHTSATDRITAVSTLTGQTFAISDHYLQKSYSFHGESDEYTEQLRVDNPSWAIMFTVTPLNDDPQYCWFEMTVTNPDSLKSQTYGFGRTYPYETYQQYPMYTTGPYTIQMKGNRVKVNLDVAKRLP